MKALFSSGLICSLFFLLRIATAAPQIAAEVPLWPNGAPGSEGMAGQKEIVEGPGPTHDNTRVHNIHNPSITPFLAPKAAVANTAVIIAPGGGHRYLSIDTEGYNVAKFLNTVGVSAFVLKYRLAHEEGSHYRVEVEALADAQRAIRLVRSRAGEWNIDPAHVVMMGFSAGGELTGLAATRYDSGKSDSADPMERESCRPDFQVLIYPGGQPTTWNITKETPPAFLLGAGNDPITTKNVPVIYAALLKAGVPAEVHVYVDGGHGFGIREHAKPLPSASTWQFRLRDWMKDRGLLPPA
ncbi:MAG TPA: alpha/beta hydrolase [Bryobacteraceae bacterium]|nr:alpha/beta hydrolase [Bryobacteraceae bacterium]